MFAQMLQNCMPKKTEFHGVNYTSENLNLKIKERGIFIAFWMNASFAFSF